VTFTVDGKTILPSKAQLHSLRRSFCRSWWNKRWRDLLQGFVAALAGSEPIISISVGANTPLTFGTVFKTFVAPESPVSSEVESIAATDDDRVEDDWEEDEAPDSPDDDLIDDLPGSVS
jgi:hypothetical protein